MISWEELSEKCGKYKVFRSELLVIKEGDKFNREMLADWAMKSLSTSRNKSTKPKTQKAKTYKRRRNALLKFITYISRLAHSQMGKRVTAWLRRTVVVKLFSGWVKSLELRV